MRRRTRAWPASPASAAASSPSSTPGRAASAEPATPACWHPAATSSPAATTTTCGTRRRSVCRSSGSSPTRPCWPSARGSACSWATEATSTWPAREAVISHDRLLENRVKELHSSTLMMRRSAFDAAGLYDEDLPHGYGEDYDWLLRASRVGSVGAVQEILADIRKDVPSWFRGRSLNTATALEYLLDKHPDFGDRRRGHARILGQIAYATRGRRRARTRRAPRGACAVPLPAAPLTPGSRSPSPDRGSSPVACWRPHAAWGVACREPAAQLLVRRARQGRVVLAARGAAQAPGRLPDAGEGPLLLRPLLRPRPARGTPRSSATPATRRSSARSARTTCSTPRRPTASTRPSARSGSWCRCATRSSAPGRRTSTCASTASDRTPSARRCAPDPSCSSTVGTPPASTGSSQRFPRELVHVALFDDLTGGPAGASWTA